MFEIFVYSITANNSCDFELGLCGYTQSTSDVFDWLRSTGVTGTSGTGPINDHTYGSSRGKQTFYLVGCLLHFLSHHLMIFTLYSLETRAKIIYFLLPVRMADKYEKQCVLYCKIT